MVIPSFETYLQNHIEVLFIYSEFKYNNCNCYLCHKIVCRFVYNQKTLDKSFFSFSYICERQAQKKEYYFKIKHIKLYGYIHKKKEDLWKHRCRWVNG